MSNSMQELKQMRIWFHWRWEKDKMESRQRILLPPMAAQPELTMHTATHG